MYNDWNKVIISLTVIIARNDIFSIDVTAGFGLHDDFHAHINYDNI